MELLTTCPECELQVSDKAAICPHCGYPISPAAKNITRKPRKRMRLPNGFGQISEIKNRNLRNPFRVMVTVGKDENGRPIPKLLKPKGYFETYNEAYAALVEYNRNPYDLDSSITMQELYDQWYEKHSDDLAPKTLSGYKSAWKYCSMIHGMELRMVRLSTLKTCIEEGMIADRNGKYHTAPTAMKNAIKALLGRLYVFAMEHDLTDKNLAESIVIVHSKKEGVQHKKHISFSEEEINILWTRQGITVIDMLLIQCYMGWRPQELCNILLENVNLTNWTFVGGMKTESGYDRIVPIHPRIQELVKRKYEEAMSIGSKYLFNEKRTTRKGTKYTHPSYERYRYALQKVIDELELNPEHKAHDGRKHFVTMAKKYKMDEYAIKRIVGHKINDVTEEVYTDRDPEWLMEEICKIP